jgi:hypothetical protein
MLSPSATFAALWLLLLAIGLYAPACAQQTPADTTLSSSPSQLLPNTTGIQSLNISAEDSLRLPDPRKAAFLSAILPGMGQVYNGGLWKVPLVYAGGVIFVNAVGFFNQRYSEYRKNIIILRANPSLPDINGVTLTVYQSAAQRARRSRDYFIILGALYYGIQIVEAHVDAHLQSFNADEELSWRIHPTLIPNPTGSMVAGIRITYTLP